MSILSANTLQSTYSAASEKLETDSVKSTSTNREDDVESIKSEIEPSTSSISGTDKSNKGEISGAAIETFQRELEKSFSTDAQGASSSNAGGSTYVSESAGTSRKSASLNRIYQSLGNSTTSISSKAASPSKSAKSNSAPSRVRYSNRF